MSYFTTDDIARIFKISIRTVRRHICSGDLEATRVGPRLVRISEESIQRYAVAFAREQAPTGDG